MVWSLESFAARRIIGDQVRHGFFLASMFDEASGTSDCDVGAIALIQLFDLWMLCFSNTTYLGTNVIFFSKWDTVTKLCHGCLSVIPSSTRCFRPISMRVS